MFTYQLDYVVEETLKNVPTEPQRLLRKYFNTDFSRSEAEFLWSRIEDHKWHVSERLARNVGNRVAAIDYFENFFEPNSVAGSKPKRGGLIGRILRPLQSSARAYFVSKSFTLPQ